LRRRPNVARFEAKRVFPSFPPPRLTVLPPTLFSQIKNFQKNEKKVAETLVRLKTSLDADRKNGYSLSVASLLLRLLTILTPLRRLRFSDANDFAGFTAA
jgi:hypothetical protein